MATPENKGLGELLVREHVITVAQLNLALKAKEQQGGRLSSQLIALGLIKEKQLAEVLAKQYKTPLCNLDEVEISAETIRLIPREMAEQFLVMPVGRAGNTLTLAMTDPGNIEAMDTVRAKTGYNINVVISTESAIKAAIEKYYGTRGISETSSLKTTDGGETVEEILSFCEPGDLTLTVDTDEADNVGDIQHAAEQAPVIRLVNKILFEAVRMRASDIHIEPSEKEFRVRLRIDGLLYVVMNLPPKLKNAVTSRVKIMSRLDIAERRKPQDGRFKMKLPNGQDIDFRVSVLPTLFGEKVVMRLLDKSNLQLDMTKLGFEPGPLADFKSAIHLPYGMVLVTGPTGSGKTTTLYSALAELNTTTENICTAEDPVEFNFPGIYQ
ncbi:MAG: ATPase, T2SS/T4P/T4SS family, partial [bacterium]|nr:ATPase, T2SS/T4P/T4SS family [bacterium]